MSAAIPGRNAFMENCLERTFASLAGVPTMLTDKQLGNAYADLWTARNSPMLDKVYQHIAAQAAEIENLKRMKS